MILDEDKTSPLDDASLLEELRAGAYGVDNRPCWIGAHRPTTSNAELLSLANWAATHYAFYETFVREYIDRRGDILDIGCGCGQNTAMLARYGNATGVDPESFGIGFAKKHNAGSGALFILDTFPCELPQFDYIFCIETIEHVEYAKQGDFLHKALDILRPDGYLFITTPNETTPSGPHRGIWSPEWLERIDEWFGCRVVRRGYFDNQRPREGFIGTTGTHHAWVMR